MITPNNKPCICGDTRPSHCRECHDTRTAAWDFDNDQPIQCFDCTEPMAPMDKPNTYDHSHAEHHPNNPTNKPLAPSEPKRCKTHIIKVSTGECMDCSYVVPKTRKKPTTADTQTDWQQFAWVNNFDPLNPNRLQVELANREFLIAEYSLKHHQATPADEPVMPRGFLVQPDWGNPRLSDFPKHKCNAWCQVEAQKHFILSPLKSSAAPTEPEHHELREILATLREGAKPKTSWWNEQDDQKVDEALAAINAKFERAIANIETVTGAGYVAQIEARKAWRGEK